MSSAARRAAARAALLVLAACSVVRPALGAITVNGTSSASTPGATSLTWPHTVAGGANRALFVGISIEDGGSSTGVTFNGTSMTLVGRTTLQHTVEIWRLVAPSVGTSNIVATFGASERVVGGAVAFDGVDQATPTGTFQGAGGTGTTPSVSVSSASGDLVLDTIYGNDGPSATPEASQTARWNRVDGPARGAGSTEAGAASVTMSWTLGASVEWQIGAVSVKAAASHSISGRVSEDANFAGTAADWDGGAADLGLANVDVELYDAGTSAYLASTTTAAGGTFTFSGLADGGYKVRARSATIGDADTPPQGTLNATVPATWPYPLAEMTWGNGAARYGGQSATVDDAATGDNAGPGDTYVTVTVSGASVTGVNLGFAYNLIVNIDDDSNAGNARSKQGSLRQFLKNANAIGTTGGTTANSSQFRMQVAANQSSGADSWWRVTTPIALPALADGGTALDGTTQTTNGGNANTLGPEIEIVGGGTINGIDLTSAGNTVRGLAASGYDGNADFAGVAINGVAATGNTVAGNYLGTNATGTAAAATTNYQGVAINGASGNTIGGPAAADRNLLSGNRWNGVRLKFAGATGNTVRGNYIGTNAAGSAAIPNQLGVYVWDVPSNVIGGTSIGAGNVISGNAQVGAYVFGAGATGNLIQGNTIGLTAGGSGGLPNVTHGVQFSSSIGNLVGGTAALAGNTIASNTLDGVNVAGAAATNNAFLSNSIRGNGGLGIDLSPTGVTPNDDADGDTGPNDLLNFPVLTAAVAGGGTVTASFDLDLPAGSYRVEFFRNPSGVDPTGSGEGETFASAVNVTHPGGGTVGFAHSFAGSVGDALTATATLCTDGAACAAFGSTSEFSAARTVQPIAVVKRAFLLDGTPVADGSVLPRATPFRFLLYVNNPGGGVGDVTLRDALDPAFGYQASSIRYDATIPSCPAGGCSPAEEATIYAAASAGTPGSDAVNGDVVSFSGGAVHAGNQNVANAQLDLPAGKVWVLVFTAKMP